MKALRPGRRKGEWRMRVQDDEFVHFTTRQRAQEILTSGKLLQNPPYKKFGTDTVDAVSTTYGKSTPGVQTTHIKTADEEGGLVAIVFKTNTRPRVGYGEEVKWVQNVNLIKPRIVSASQGRALIARSPASIDDWDGHVIYEGMSMPGRVLREADKVRIVAEGPRRGRIGQVVGHDLTTDRLVVQYPRAIDGISREALQPQDIEVVEGDNMMTAPEALEPLPEIRRVLQEEGDRPSYKTCGRFLCMTLRENGTTLTFVPREDGTDLKEVADKQGVEALFEVAFVTRLPHLVRVGNSHFVSAALEEENALETILASEV